MISSQIRDAFLGFFEKKQHKIIPSSSLIPHGDPTLLLTTAGMVQMKPYFLGINIPPSTRLASCQKCFRTTDIDSIGDAKHLTFFEMLGNFSVGDYFKKEAIAWAWEFVTNRLKVETDRLWVTVFSDDDEAFEIWREIGFPTDRIVRLGEKDNFWGPAGNSGPCGPCSEIHYDFGEKMGCGDPECDPACDCNRFSEIWNLVFMEYNQDDNGKRTKLPKPNIDTGMGLERISAVMQGVCSVYDTDLFLPIKEKICSLADKIYDGNNMTDRAIRIIAEHGRGIPFLIADGVLPSNEGRGYILRRIVRRAVFYGSKLGIKRVFVDQVCSEVIQNMGNVYPELLKNEPLIMQLVRIEEEKFLSTLDAGISLAESSTKEAIKKGRTFVPGEEVFRLWDTYGFPAELTADIAGRKGLDIDLHGFDAELEKQKDRARASRKNHLVESGGNTVPPAGIIMERTKFVGYDETESKARILQLIDNKTGQPIINAKAGQSIFVILDRTPFYGEMGGQAGDSGLLVSGSCEVHVMNAIAVAPEKISIAGDVKQGTVSVGDTVNATVDIKRRLNIGRNHTATHLLQSALRTVLGNTVQQRGSLVTPERLRFDFSHPKAISKQQLAEIQYLVNKWIRENLTVSIINDVPYQKAVDGGAIALFDEKYGDSVRVIKVGNPPVSSELCGGIHIKSTGGIGLFLIVSESSIGSGLRRIEAVTGSDADKLLEKRFMVLEEIADKLKSSIDEAPRKVEALIAELSTERKRLAALEKGISRNTVDSLQQKAKDINGIKMLTAKIPASSVPTLRDMADMLRDKLGSAIIVLATIYEGKPHFVAAVTPDLVEKGLHAGDMVRQVAEVTGGGGGGKATMAQAGGRDKDKVDEALKLVEQLIRKGR